MARCVTEGCEGKNLAAVTLAEWNAPAPAMTAPMTREELLEKAVRMFVAWDDGTHETSPAAWHDQAMAAAREALRGVAQSPAPVAWRWRTLPKFSEDAADQEWSVTLTSPDFINPHHHEVQPLYAAPQQSPRLEREGIARLLFERKPTRHPQGLIPTWDKQPPNIRESYYGDADAILALLSPDTTVVSSTDRAHPEGCACDRCQGRPLKRSVSSNHPREVSK